MFFSNGMKNFNRHILHRVNFEFNTSEEPKAFEFKSKVDTFLKEDLLPDIEILLDELASPEEIKRFESIDIEVYIKPDVNFGDLRNLLVSQLRGKIENTESEYFKTVENESSSVIQSNIRKNQNTGVDFGLVNAKEVDLLHKGSTGKLNNLQNAFLYFLETGQLPWYATTSFLNEFIRHETFQAALDDKIFLQKLTKQFTSDTNSLERFVQQMDNEMIEFFIFHLLREKTPERTVELQLTQYLTQPEQVQFYRLMITSLMDLNFQISKALYKELEDDLLSGQIPDTLKERLINQLQEVLRIVNPAFKKLVIDLVAERTPLNEEKPNMSEEKNHRPDKESQVNPDLSEESDFKDIEKMTAQNSEKSIEQTALYVQNAGLILAHPFLSNLFTHTNCVLENRLLPDKKSLAVHLLHYLATGAEQEFECNLVFEKYLCGISPEFPINRKLLLTDQEKSECDDLLKSMIGHWTALKNSSPDTLRQMFLQRDGKLDLQQALHKLYMEHQSYDILLNSLPWGISIVKLPWMTELLFVEWQ